MTNDPFSVLGVGPDATLDEVRMARRRLAARFHPDHGGDASEDGRDQRGLRRRRRPFTESTGPGSASRLAHRTPESSPFRRYPGVQHDAPSFTIDSLPVEAFEALLVVTSWIGEVLVDDPPYVLEVHLDEPSPCWCRLDLVPDAGSSTVSLTVASIDGTPPPTSKKSATSGSPT